MSNDNGRITRNACPVCGGVEHEPLFQHGEWRLVRCAGCALAYLPEIPSDAAIETEFEWSESFNDVRYERWARNPLMRLWTAAIWTLKPNREQRAMRRIRRWAPPGRMLDVGCGDGRLIACALHQGYEPVGVELSAVMAAKARRRAGDERVVCGRLDDCDFAPGSFDLIVAVSYLEHEPEPARIMARLAELLRPGGTAAFKVPNYDSRLRRLLGRRWSGYRWPEHVQYFTPTTMGRLVCDAGLSVAGVRANPLSDNFWLAARHASHDAGGTEEH